MSLLPRRRAVRQRRGVQLILDIERDAVFIASVAGRNQITETGDLVRLSDHATNECITGRTYREMLGWQMDPRRSSCFVGGSSHPQD